MSCMCWRHTRYSSFSFFLVLDVFLAAHRAAATGAMYNRDAAWEELAAMCSRRMFVVRIM